MAMHQMQCEDVELYGSDWNNLFYQRDDWLSLWGVEPPPPPPELADRGLSHVSSLRPVDLGKAADPTLGARRCGRKQFAHAAALHTTVNLSHPDGLATAPRGAAAALRASK